MRHSFYKKGSWEGGIILKNVENKNETEKELKERGAEPWRDYLERRNRSRELGEGIVEVEGDHQGSSQAL